MTTDADPLAHLHFATAALTKLASRLDAATRESANLRRLLWCVAAQSGGVLILTRRDLDKFDPSGTLEVQATPDGGFIFKSHKGQQP